VEALISGAELAGGDELISGAEPGDTRGTGTGAATEP